MRNFLASSLQLIEILKLNWRIYDDKDTSKFIRANVESRIDSSEKESGAKTNLSKATLVVLSIVRSLARSARFNPWVFHTASLRVGSGTNDDRV